jgi:hypothetical protein
MPTRLIGQAAVLSAALMSFATPSSAQILESVGGRALGMGGAFVAVASDSTASWWYPGALAAGPFVDLSLGKAFTEAMPGEAGRRDRAGWFALTTPPFGASYYRLRITDIPAFTSTTDPAGANREDRGAAKPVRSLAAGQLGVTLVHTIFPGVHAGTTLKYLRGTVRQGRIDGSASEVLEFGEELEGGGAENHFDLDVGVLATAGALRLGGVVRNLRQPEFGADAGPAGMRLERQVRVGAAFDPEDATGVPLTIAFDADVKTYSAGQSDRRVIAVGAEQWLASRRVGVRAGGRFNRVGARERSATAGASVMVRSGTFVDGYLVRGDSADERGWGLTARVSF